MSITRKFAAGVLTVTLVLSSTGVAAAQSSFGNLSSSTVAPQPEPNHQPDHNPAPSVDQQIYGEERDKALDALANYHERLGYTVAPDASEIAQGIADAAEQGMDTSEVWDAVGLNQGDSYSIDKILNLELHLYADIYDSNPETVKHHGLPIGLAYSGNSAYTYIISYEPAYRPN